MGETGGDLGGSAEEEAGGSRGELLRAGRPFGVGDPGSVTHPAGPGSRATGASDVRATDDSGIGQGAGAAEERRSDHGRADRACRSGAGSPAVVCATAALVHRSTGAWAGNIQCAWSRAAGRGVGYRSAPAKSGANREAA